jgi:hypothetical protein
MNLCGEIFIAEMILKIFSFAPNSMTLSDIYWLKKIKYCIIDKKKDRKNKIYFTISLMFCCSQQFDILNISHVQFM